MKKTIASFLMACLAVIHASAWDSGQSVYRLRPNDAEAVYFTEEDFPIRNDGSVDVTEQLQEALNRVKRKYNFGIVFLPSGEYRISRTVYVPPAVRLIGYGATRPLIVLAENSPDFQQAAEGDKGKASYMLWFTGDMVEPGQEVRDAGAGTFYSALSNVDLKIGDGNPFAVALRTHFAQHSFISHSCIDAGQGKAGLFDVGNEMEDVHFRGGDYGIYTTKTSPSWQMMMTDVSFEGQRKAAVYTQEGGLTIVRMAVRNVPVAVEIAPERSDKIYMEDCLLENVAEAGVMVSQEKLSPNQLSMNNVACRNVPVLCRFRESGRMVRHTGRDYRVERYSCGLHVRDMVAQPEWKEVAGLSDWDGSGPMLVRDIPDLPDMGRWVNLAELGAVGDNKTDNTEVFRKAIERYEVIYVPQGWYVVSEPLKLKPNTCLIGLNPVSTQIKIRESTPAFSGFGSPQPLLETPRGGRNIVTGIGLNTGAYNYRAVGCKWMSGADSYMNDVKFLGVHGTMTKGPVRKAAAVPRRISTPEEPVADLGMDQAWDNQHWSLWITNGGGGTFKDIWTASSYAANGLYVSDTSTPGRIYAMSVEHHVRNEARFKNVSNWKVYALQLEEETRESKDCQPIELENCSDMMFANLYLFRVIRVTTPCPYAIRTWSCRNIEFFNVHNFTQMRFTTDLVCYDINKGLDVRPWEFTRLTITGDEPAREVPQETVRRLATGFEFVEGIARDSRGNIYFCEQRMRRVYRWDAHRQSLSLVADFPWQPLSLAVDSLDNLLVLFKYVPQPGYRVDGKQEAVDELPDAAGTTFSHWGNTGFATWVYSIDPDCPEETIALLPRKAASGIKTVHKAIYPAHRWRDLHDFRNVCLQKPDWYFVAPDGKTVIPEIYDFARSSSVVEAFPGKAVYAADEYNHLLARMTVNSDGTLAGFARFACQGEFGWATDREGNVYIAEGDVHVYDKNGRHVRVIPMPERPSALVVGGENQNTLFITARSSFYSVELQERR